MTLLLPTGAKLVHFDEIDSTNAEAHRRVLNGERGPLWLVADRQAGGRGRHGRHWVSEKGNLFATLLLALPITPAIATQVSFVAALAVVETVRPLIAQESGLHLALKWPNDVLIGGRKLAGILAETASLAEAGELAVIIGFGLNLAHAPPGTPYAVTCLADHGCAASRDELFAALAVSVSRQLAAWSLGEGFDVVRQCWLAAAAGLGGRVGVDTGQGRIEGAFVNLAADGALILRLDDGEQRAIYGGEVTFAEIDRLRSPT